MLARKAAAALFAVTLATGAAADDLRRNAPDGLGLRGYDPVAYQTLRAAVPGDAAIAIEHDGIEWRFSSAQNREAFVATPERYLPAYGGFCAWATAHGYKADADPEAWTVVDGRLFVNYNREVQAEWLPERDRLIVEGDRNWPTVEALTEIVR
jgi:YHS domain-containing protein